MREAYSLLRQSIIHVEQDDISFDDGLDDEMANGTANATHGTGNRSSGAVTAATDAEMDAEDAAALDAAEASYQEQQLAQAQRQADGAGKRKMRITCECSLNLLHLLYGCVRPGHKASTFVACGCRSAIQRHRRSYGACGVSMLALLLFARETADSSTSPWPRFAPLPPPSSLPCLFFLVSLRGAMS